MLRIPVNPRLFRWARERFRFAREDLAGRFNRLPEWRGEMQPILKQVRRSPVPSTYQSVTCSNESAAS